MIYSFSQKEGGWLGEGEREGALLTLVHFVAHY